MSSIPQPALDVHGAVKARYSRAAAGREESLCCPTSVNPALLAALPSEVLEIDYGCGDPTRHLAVGEIVLDLGSGSGKACFMASQVVGPAGRVIGVDLNDDMLALARRHAPDVARNIGHANVEFRKGHIQDLALDLSLLDRYLEQHPVRAAQDLSRLEIEIARLRAEQPLVPDSSVDVVVSNCVLNLVGPSQKRDLFREIYRTLRQGGRAVISDIVCDEDVPEHLRLDPELWSGCISGAFREDHFLEAFEEAGFHGIHILERQEAPWRTVAGIEFRSLTVAAYKGKEGPCFDQKHAVIYRGPFRAVTDDDGHVLRRGVRSAVCEKTYRLYSQEPYRAHFEPVPPRDLLPPGEAPAFPCGSSTPIRHPRETKGGGYEVMTHEASGGCSSGDAGPGSCC